MKTLKNIAILWLLVPACGEQTVDSAAGSGGQGGTSNGGITSYLGGATSIGGTKGAGGAGNTGGMSNVGDTGNTGGATSTGGTSSTGVTTSAGGVTSAGGTDTTAGTITTGGTPNAGGTNADGGTVTTGGTPSAGGINANGGTVTTGGAITAGGTTATGVTTSACGLAPVVLGAADNFIVLAGSTVTNTGPTSLTGDLGVSPGTAVTGFGPGTIIGTQHVGDPAAAQAEVDLTAAYNDAAGRTLCPIAVAGNLGGQTLTPGLYKSTSSLEISSGDLTLDAQGNANAVFIFQMASTLTTTSGRQVILSGGAKSNNVFWQVGTSATLGSTSAFEGTIIADQAITLDTGVTLNGRVLARVAAVTLDSNTIVKPAS